MRTSLQVMRGLVEGVVELLEVEQPEEDGSAIEVGVIWGEREQSRSQSKKYMYA